MNAILIVCVVMLAMVAALALLLGRFKGDHKPGMIGDPARISASRYRPMERLLDPAEEAFIAGHAGRAALRRFRAERRRIFRAYLRSLERDFGSLCGAVRLLLVHSERDRADLASALMRREARFAIAVFNVRCRLVLHAAGIGHVDVGALVGALSEVRADLAKLVPAPAGAAA